LERRCFLEEPTISELIILSRQVQFEVSPITKMFGGQFRSMIRSQGSKETSVTLEPFHAIHLDIHNDSITNVSDALALLTVPEDVTYNNKSAKKQNFIEVLNPVLVLHAKRFQYDATHGTVKSRKQLAYSHNLEIDKGMLCCWADG
jgi:ubiquitin carboxyl-terminal hydrolase 10